jgi:tetratricopeptide (TPR) repeat protein
MHLFRSVSVVSLGILLPVSSARPVHSRDGATASPLHHTDEAARLNPGKTIERTLAGGETHFYEIQLQAGQFLHAVVQQLGIDVTLTLSGPGGAQIAMMDSPNGKHGPEKISTIAESPGTYKLSITALDKNATRGRYRVSIEPPRAPSDADRERISAERAFSRARGTTASRDADALRLAAQTYEQALSAWQAAGDSYEAALTLQTIGALYDSLRERQKALDFYNRALEIEKTVGDRDGEGATLNNMGYAYSGLGEKEKALDSYNRALSLRHALSDQQGEASTLISIGGIYEHAGDKHRALEYYNQALALRQSLGDRNGQASALNYIGGVYQALGENSKAMDYYKQALTLRRDLSDRRGESVMLNSIGNAYLDLGEKEKALDYYLHALPLVRAEGEKHGEVVILDNIARTYRDLGEDQKALDYYSQTLPVERATSDQKAEVVTLNDIAAVYDRLDQREKALDFYDQALSAVRAAGDKKEEAVVLNFIGGVYVALSDKAKALDRYNQALALEAAAGNQKETAVTLGGIANVYYDFGDKEKALDYYNQALEIHRVLDDRKGEASSLNRIGNLYYDLGKKEKSLDYYNQALLLDRALDDGKAEITVLINIGNAQSSIAKRDVAFDYYHQATNRALTLGDRVGEARALNSIGSSYADLGQEEKALEYYNQALPLMRSAGDRFGEAATLDSMGKAYAHLGEKYEALDAYNQALRLRRDLGDRRGQSRTLNGFGVVYDSLGEKRKALDYYNQAQSIALAVGDRLGEAATLDNVGKVYANLGENEKALDYYNQALRLRRDLGDRVGEATALNNLAIILGRFGSSQVALHYYSQALVLSRATGDRRGEGVTLDNLALLYDRLGDKSQALENFSQALATDYEVQDPISESIVLTNLMDFWRRVGEPATAIFYGKQAIDKIQQVRANILGLENEDQRSFLKSKQQVYRKLGDLLITQGRLPEAQQILDLLKNQEYFEFVRRDGKEASSLTASIALTKDETQLSRKYKEGASRIAALGNEWSTLRAKSLRTPDEEQQLAELNEQLKNANREWEKFLSDLHADLKTTKGAEETADNIEENASGMKSELRQLDAGTVALYTLVGDDKYRVILITPAVTLAREYPIPAAELRRKVLEFRQVLQDPTRNPLPLAKELYKILLGPVASELDGAQATTLMWSLDDVLRYLPIAALHDGHDYLVAKYRNAVFTPASIPHLADRSEVKDWRGIGMGVSKSYGQFSALPAVRNELHRIIRENDTGAQGVLPGQMMLDDTFTVENMKKALEKGYPLVHIASHFDFEPGNESNSFLLLGGLGTQGEHLTLAQLREDPEFDFHDVDLLTLSACDTALGGAAGDGREVDGLGRLAQQKGAKAVVATLWSVNDESTGLLMEEFYRLWTTRDGMSKAEALREAQRSLLHGNSINLDGTQSFNADEAENPTVQGTPRGVHTAGMRAPTSYSHPYYWAPFILIGNWR